MVLNGPSYALKTAVKLVDKFIVFTLDTPYLRLLSPYTIIIYISLY